jgi:hypothetical protein
MTEESLPKVGSTVQTGTGEKPRNVPERSINEIISLFDKRSRARRLESYSVLVVMLILLGLATWVFIKAKEITANETNPNTQALLSSLQKRKADATVQIQEIAKDILVLLQELGELKRAGPQHSPAKYNIELADESGRLRTRNDVITELSNDLARTGYNYIDYEIRIRANSLSNIQLRVSRETLKTVDNKLKWPTMDLGDVVARLQPLSHDVTLVDAALNQITSNERSGEVQALIGKNDQANPNLSLPFLVQLNVTRFGTLTLVAIAIGLLSPLYRFSARLAAFHQARADALRLHQVGYSDVSIIGLVDALTPKFDFDKSSAAADRLSELVNIVATGAKSAKE